MRGAKKRKMKTQCTRHLRGKVSFHTNLEFSSKKRSLPLTRYYLLDAMKLPHDHSFDKTGCFQYGMSFLAPPSTRLVNSTGWPGRVLWQTCSQVSALGHLPPKHGVNYISHQFPNEGMQEKPSTHLKGCYLVS